MRTMDAAQGKWQGILSSFGIDDSYLRNKSGPCPCCGGKDRYRFDDNEGKGTYYCNGCGAGTGIDLLMKWTGWDFKTAATKVDEIVHNVSVKEPVLKKDPRVKLRRIQRELVGCGDITPVNRYLRSRGLHSVEALKYHAGLDCYGDDGYEGRFPAMVARVDSIDGDPVTFHLTHLTQAGEKAPVKTIKKILPPVMKIQGAAIRLASVGEVMAVTEGIETALAVMRDYKIPTWSLINANNLELFKPPEGVKQVVIFGDNDANFAGQKSAYVLANRLVLRGIGVEVRIPDVKGTDFADKETV